MIGSVIIYMVSTQIYRIHYADALFMTISAMTGTGLSVVRLWCTSFDLHRVLLTWVKLDLSTQNHIQQAALFVLMLLGHSIPISGIVLVYRRRNLRRIIKESASEKLVECISPHTLALESQISNCRPIAIKNAEVVVCERAVAIEMKGDPADCSSHPESDTLPQHGLAIGRGSRFCSDDSQKVISFMTCRSKQSERDDKTTHLLSIGSRSRALVQHMQERLQSDIPGHLDEPEVLVVKATQLLSLVVLIYFTVILLLGILAISIWLKLDLPDIARAYNVAPSWAGAFLATSAFSNNGMSLIDANMVPFQQE